MKKILLILTLLLTGFAAWAQKPGATPVRVSTEKQMMNGRKYYVHIVEKGQTVYSITKAYRVESYDAITHVDIHSLHPGDTVWIPFRGQFTESEEREASMAAAPTVRVDTVHIYDTTYIKVPYAVHDTTVLTKTVTQTEYVTVRDTTYINVPYAVHDTVVQKEYVTVRDTTYINVPYAVHDTVTLTQKEYVTERDTAYITLRDTTYINVPYAVHDTVVQKEYVTVRDTTYINVPYAVHDTVTLTQKEYVTERDTAYITLRDTTYINVPYAVHDTVVQKEYVTVRDTTYINVPYAVHDTVTLTQKEYVTERDTAYITLRDTTMVHDTVTVTQKEYVPVHDTSYIYVNNTTVVTDTLTLTQKEFVTLRDTSYITVYDTTYVNVPYAVHDTTYITVYDTTYINVPYAVHDTTIVTDTVTLTHKEFVPVHDTTYVSVNNTTVVTDTLTLTQKEYVTVHDTTYITVYDTTYINVPYAVHDTTFVVDTVTITQKEVVPVHDTSYVYINNTVTDTLTLTQKEYVTVRDTTILHDTVRVKEYVPVHDTTYVYINNTVVDTLTLTQKEYVTVRDTAYITLRDTTILRDTVTLTRTEYVKVHDTTYITVRDTIVVFDTVDFPPASTMDLAFASTSAVAMTGSVPSNETASGPAPQRKVGKTLKVALMMPLHLDQIGQISTSKFDVEQRGKRSYRQFEFIEFYEGVLLALDRLAEQGINVELNVVDVSENSAAKVEEAFASHHVDRSDVVVALLLRDAFDKAAELSRQAGIYIVNPMTPRSELCAENPYMVKIQPSLSGMIALMLDNMKLERPNGHLYIIHSNAKAEKAAMDELKRQLTERGDIKYTIFNWSQSAKLASVLKATPSCNVVSIYEQGKDNNRVFSINLLNRLSSIKKDSPTLYTFTDWTREYNDIDFSQLQLLNYHTFSQNWDMTNDVHVQFLQSFRTRFGAEPTTTLASTAYDLMLYVVGGLAKRSSDFWTKPGPSLPTLIQPLHLGRSGAGLENDRAQLYRMEDMRFIKALYK